MFFLKRELIPILCGLFISAAAGGLFINPGKKQVSAAEDGAFPVAPAELPLDNISQDNVFQNPAAYRSFTQLPEQRDMILEAYMDHSTQKAVLSLFSVLIGSEELASAILTGAGSFNISPGLAFALCWEESRYNPLAVNRKNRNASIDRGLFQLNSLSFPKLTEADFFNPYKNAYYGMSHLRWCIDAGGSEIAGLAMYNAGTNRVRSGGTPKITLDYISRILNLKRNFEEIFKVEYSKITASKAAAPPQEDKPGRSWLALLIPISRR
jgi:soluble lytic murein transglycosylase-like protein